MVAPDEYGEDGGAARAEELTRDAWKRGIWPAELWATPIHQLLFVWYKQPSEASADVLETVTRQNQNAKRPFIQANILTKYRR